MSLVALLKALLGLVVMAITMATTKHLLMRVSALLAPDLIHQVGAMTIHAPLVLLAELDQPGLV